MIPKSRLLVMIHPSKRSFTRLILQGRNHHVGQKLIAREEGPEIFQWLGNQRAIGALHGGQARPADFVGDIADHRIMPSNRAGITPVWYYGIMAARKMTFSLPQPLAMQLLKSVAPRDRSRYVAEALAVKLRVQDEELARACDLANQDEETLSIEREFDAISSDIAEPWNNAPAR